MTTTTADWAVLPDELRHLENDAVEVVLFGSRAAGLATPSSDWDLLCIGEGRTHLGKGLDLVWLGAERLRSADWLGSELANHIAHHGRWLKGHGDWRTKVHPSIHAVRKKTASLELEVVRLERLWPHFGLGYRTKFRRQLRRDAQRLALLIAGMPVPPTAVLDRDWQLAGSPSRLLDDASSLSVAARAGLQRLFCSEATPG